MKYLALPTPEFEQLGYHIGRSCARFNIAKVLDLNITLLVKAKSRPFKFEDESHDPASAKNKPIDAIISWRLNERRMDGCYSKCKFKFKLSQK